LNFLPFSCSPSLTFDVEQTVGVREQPWAASVPSMAGFKSRCRASRPGTFRLPGERKGACWNLEEGRTKPFAFFAQGHTCSQAPDSQSNIGSGYSVASGFCHAEPLSRREAFLDNQWQDEWIPSSFHEASVVRLIQKDKEGPFSDPGLGGECV
jgi:hypothetical protein